MNNPSALCLDVIGHRRRKAPSRDNSIRRELATRATSDVSQAARQHSVSPLQDEVGHECRQEGLNLQSGILPESRHENTMLTVAVRETLQTKTWLTIPFGLYLIFRWGQTNRRWGSEVEAAKTNLLLLIDQFSIQARRQERVRQWKDRRSRNARNESVDHHRQENNLLLGTKSIESRYRSSFPQSLILT